MLRQPQRQPCRIAGIFVDFDAVELRQPDVREGHDALTARELPQAVPYPNLEGSDGFVGDDEEITRTAGGVEELDFRQPHEQLIQPFGVVLAVGVLVDEGVEEERADDLLNVGDRRIMNAQTRTHVGG